MNIKTTTSSYYTFVLGLAIIIFSACTTLPKTADQTVYATYGVYVTVANSTAELLDQGAISKDRAIKVQKQLQEIRPSIDIAVSLARQGKPVPADTMAAIKLAQTVLLEIQKELTRRMQP